jgi:hypothetical protein
MPRRANPDMRILNSTIDHAHASLFNPMISTHRPNIDEVNFHFNNLKKLARKLAPQTLGKITFLHNIVCDHCHGKLSDYDALEKIRAVIISEGLNMNIYHSAKASLGMRRNFPMMNPMAPVRRGFNLNPRPNKSLNEMGRGYLDEFKQKPVQQLKFRKHKKKEGLFKQSPFSGLKPPRWF